MSILKGYRTYIAGAAIVLQQLLVANGITMFDNQAIETTLTVILALLVLLFRRLANTEK